MKKPLLIVLFLFAGIVSAQTKVGTINTEYILSRMPEFKDVQSKLQVYGKTLDDGVKEKFTEYEAKVKDYQEKETTFTDALKQLKQKDIIKLEEDIQKLRTNSAKLLQVRQEELLRPLYNKIGQQVEKIVTAEKFTHVFNENNNLIYIDPKFDITIKVMKAMGIPVEEETTEN